MGDASQKLGEMLDAIVAQAVPPGVQVEGCCVATQTAMFSGGMRALIVTPDKLIIQPVDRKWHATGSAVAIAPHELAAIDVNGLGDGWYNTAISLFERAGVDLKIRTTSGTKFKLMMMSGEGRVFGPLGGGETQSEGVAALLEWLRRAGDQPANAS